MTSSIGIEESFATTSSSDQEIPAIYTIACVGSGISGVAMLAASARGLLPSSYHVILVERDESPTVREQGYSLTIQQGVEFLRALGPDVERKCRRYAAENDSKLRAFPTSFSMEEKEKLPQTLETLAFETINGCTGETMYAGGRQRGAIPSQRQRRFSNFAIPREGLRDTMLSIAAAHQADAPTNKVLWGTTLKSFDVLEDKVILHLTSSSGDTTALVVDALIGCDGIRSSVRQQLLGDDPRYTGLMMINGIAETTNELFRNRVFQALDGQVRVFGKPFAVGMAMWQLTFPATEEEALSLSSSSSGEREETLRGLYKLAVTKTTHFVEPTASVITETPLRCLRGGPLYDRPPLECVVDQKNDSMPVTLVGDALHPMTPFKGQGANSALMDVLNLCRQLSNCSPTTGSNIAAAFRAHETESLQRTRSKVLGSAEAARFTHTSECVQPGKYKEWIEGKRGDKNNQNDS